MFEKTKVECAEAHQATYAERSGNSAVTRICLASKAMMHQACQACHLAVAGHSKSHIKCAQLAGCSNWLTWLMFIGQWQHPDIMLSWA